MKKKSKKKIITSSETIEITQINIYNDPTTGKPPRILIDLSSADSYKNGILALRAILTLHREDNKLIPFQIYYGNTEEKTFLMRCSDAYIVGYQIHGKIEIFNYKKLSYPTNKNLYDFYNIDTDLSSLHNLGYIIAEAVRSRPIFRYIKNLIADSDESHVLNIDDNVFGMPKLELNLGTFESNNIIYSINSILDKLKIFEIAHAWGNSKDKKDKIITKPKIEKLLTDSFTILQNQLDKIVTETEKNTKLLAQLSSNIEYYQELLYSDSDDESEEDKSSSSEENYKRTPYELKAIYSARIKETEEELEKTFLAIHPEENQAIEALPAGTVVEIPDEAFYDWTEQGCTLAYFQALQESVDLFLMYQNLEKAMNYIATIYSKMQSGMGAAIKSIPKSANSTTADIAQGLYAELSNAPEHYSKIPGSEKFNYQLSTSDHHPDDNSGSGAIAISPKENDDTKHSNIEWVENIDYKEVREYLLSLGTIQRMQETLAKMKSMLDKPTKLDFIIKRAYEIAVFSGCMLVTPPTKDLSGIENKITICSALTTLAGVGYDSLTTESWKILGQIEVN